MMCSRSQPVQQSSFTQHERSAAYRKHQFSFGRLIFEPRQHSRIVHFASSSKSAGNNQNVQVRTIIKSVFRINAQATSGDDRPRFLSYRVHYKRFQSLSLTRYGEDFEWPAEIEHFDTIEND